MNIPTALIFINSDVSQVSISTLTTQLFLNEIITDTEFSARLAVDPDYVSNIHANNLRVMVLKDFVLNTIDNANADLVLYVKSGLASILKNNNGPPGLALPLNNLYIHKLLRYNNSQYTTNLPNTSNYVGSGLGGIFALKATDTSGVHLANTDNEANNTDFKNRK